MAKKKSLAEVNAEIASVEKEIRQSQNLIKRLEQQAKKEERNARTKRLIERGAILESLVPDAVNYSNEQIKTLLLYALDTSCQGNHERLR